MVAVVLVSGDDGALRHPLVAWIAVVAVLGAAATATADMRLRPERLLAPLRSVAEASLAVGLSIVDGWVFEPGHVFETSQSLATLYPVIAVASVGLASGPWWAAAVGAAIGPAEGLAAVLNDFGPFEPRHVISLIATSLFFAATGAIVGWFGGLLRDAEQQVADRRARDEVARVMHDSVLQVFAAVERRIGDSDPDLLRTVRDADRDLRRFLFGASSRSPSSLDAAVRDRVERATAGSDLTVTVNVLVDAAPDSAVVDAISGAIGEAATNAVKHASASHLTVFVEDCDDGSLVATVRDDGTGMATHQPLGDGLRHSVIARMRDVGGDAEIRRPPDGGTEVVVRTLRGAR
jgi:signal transduction histidine kinase